MPMTRGHLFCANFRMRWVIQTAASLIVGTRSPQRLAFEGFIWDWQEQGLLQHTADGRLLGLRR